MADVAGRCAVHREQHGWGPAPVRLPVQRHLGDLRKPRFEPLAQCRFVFVQRLHRGDDPLTLGAGARYEVAEKPHGSGCAGEQFVRERAELEPFRDDICRGQQFVRTQGFQQCRVAIKLPARWTPPLTHQVAPGDEDLVDRQVPVGLLGPVVEQELAEARALHALEELLGDDLVGVDVVAHQHGHGTGDRLDGLHDGCRPS